ncbi:DUF5916 domain-containing protein [Flavivirga algicola]|uniref:Carbohydrate binding family 9 domain-containing protein n=1 Tax=Flavivirga algicola TaxID=2729136 RepID=A0ABX1S0W1_9FLAO|nr:DUF5916 domain-containing protein [Flavivirga algicola]NMH88986.1 carbohydrate binding family 9 domain-containing protein [Flavivirga algicola]
MKTSLLAICAIFAVQAFLAAQDSTAVIVQKKRYTTKALYNHEAPVIDGLLNDASWDIVDWAGDYIEHEPDENTPPTFQTRFKIVYDQKFLYIGVRCYDDAPDKIVKRLSRRDGFEGDWIEFNFDSYHDQRSAFSFNISAAGVKGDEFVSNNGNNWDASWNPIWYAKTNIDSEGWTAEFKIPLSQFKFGKLDKQIWGLQSIRRIFRKEERSLWQRKPVDMSGWVSAYGELHGLINLEPQKQLEIQPYFVVKGETYEPEAGNPFKSGSSSEVTAGLDAKIGITNDLTLDLTVNPDFGQVEADPSAIALDGFQVFFREQRPFFVENKNIFNYRISQSQAGNTFGSDNLFYSRRIGRSPQGSVDSSDDEFVDQPENTPILGAAKFSGKTKSGWSIGVLESLTAKRHAIIDNNGVRRNETVEPLTNYFVGRVQKDFNEGKTFVGGIFTATNRDDLTEELDFLHTSAYSGGLDFKHQWHDRDWYVGGNLIWSHVLGSEEAIQNTQESITHLFQRVDADHVSLDSNKTSLTGSGGNLQIGKVGDGHWKFESGTTWRSPELELNDIGFQRQSDDIRHYTWVGYQTLKPDKTFRRVGINYNHWSVWDFGGNHNTLRFNVNSWQRWKSNWFSNIGFNYTPVNFSNFALRGGPRLRISPEISHWNSIRTDDRKKVRFNIFHNRNYSTDGSYRSNHLELGLRYRPINALSLSVSPSYSVNKDKLQYIDNIDFNGDTRYLNGTIAQQTLRLSLRINYNINPNFTVQYWGQPFISRGRYSNFKYINNSLASNFDARFSEYNMNQLSLIDDVYEVDDDLNGTADFAFDNPDFSFIQFRSNLVLRWEYIPGSEIFLVWSQDISQSGNPQEGLFKSLGNNVFGEEKPQNIFLLKATYRFLL